MFVRNIYAHQARPFGVALLIGGVDETGPCLYHTDPTGTMIKYQAKGMGAADEGLQSILQTSYNPVISSLLLEECEIIDSLERQFGRC